MRLRCLPIITQLTEVHVLESVGCLQTMCVYDRILLRVEGLSGAAGSVIITDVTYSTETKSLQVEEEGEGEGEYVRLQGVIKEKQKELKHLVFKEAALDQEKALLNSYASHVTKVSNKEASVLISQP